MLLGKRANLSRASVPMMPSVSPPFYKAKVTVFVPLGFPLVRRLPECEALWAFFA
jgi:hypothetical protein